MEPEIELEVVSGVLLCEHLRLLMTDHRELRENPFLESAPLCELERQQLEFNSEFRNVVKLARGERRNGRPLAWIDDDQTLAMELAKSLLDWSRAGSEQLGQHHDPEARSRLEA